MATPKDFIKYPWGSVFENSERETVALNIMKILSRTGNEWRTLSWDEYLEERVKDGGGNTHNQYYLSEKDCFEDVIRYTVSESTAKLFCSDWSEVQ